MRRRKQVTMFGGGHTDYCWKRRITREREEGAYCRSETGVSMVQIDLQGKHLLNILHIVVYNVFIVAVFIEGDHLCEGLEVIVAHKAPKVKLYVQSSLLQLFVKPVVGSSPSTVKGLKDALDQVF